MNVTRWLLALSVVLLNAGCTAPAPIIVERTVEVTREVTRVVTPPPAVTLASVPANWLDCEEVRDSHVGGEWCVWGTVERVFADPDGFYMGLYGCGFRIASKTFEFWNDNVGCVVRVCGTVKRVYDRFQVALTDPAQLMVVTDTCSGAVDAPEAPDVPVRAQKITGCPQGCIVPPVGCNIKGNVTFEGSEKIYHVPGCDYYEETRINTDYGERWFCTEAEAQAAGWREAHNCP